MKLIILAAVVVGDLAALAIAGPRLVRQGKGQTALILAGAMFASMIGVAVVLFLVVE